MLTLRDAMNGPSNSYSHGAVALGPGSGVPRAAREGVELEPTFVDGLRELVESGVPEFALQHPNGMPYGMLYIRPNFQLIPPQHAQISSNGFCFLSFVTSPGRYTQFEIDLNRGVVTVARKPSFQNGKQRGFSSFLGHTEMINLLSELVHKARLQVAHQQIETGVAIGESVRETGERVDGVLGAQFAT